MKTIAALLTVFNRREYTLKCLSRLYAQQPMEGYALDVYLTDDGCTDGTPEAVSERFPKVHIVKGDGTLFWNRGMIAAWKEAAKGDYDFYLWLNDDTFPYSCMLPVLTKATEEHSGAILVGATESADHKQMTYGGSYKGVAVRPAGKLVPLTCFNGNIVLVPRSVFLRLGYLDSYFRHSKGDFDYAMRAHEAGIEMYLADRFLGECDLHPRIDKWCDPEVPFCQRWRMLHRPNGMPPKEIFHLERRHYGVCRAVFHYFTVYLRCLCPWLWKNC